MARDRCAGGEVLRGGSLVRAAEEEAQGRRSNQQALSSNMTCLVRHGPDLGLSALWKMLALLLRGPRPTEQHQTTSAEVPAPHLLLYFSKVLTRDCVRGHVLIESWSNALMWPEGHVHTAATVGRSLRLKTPGLHGCSSLQHHG